MNTPNPNLNFQQRGGLSNRATLLMVGAIVAVVVVATVVWLLFSATSYSSENPGALPNAGTNSQDSQQAQVDEFQRQMQNICPAEKRGDPCWTPQKITPTAPVPSSEEINQMILDDPNIVKF